MNVPPFHVSYWICQQYPNIYFQEDRPIPEPGVGGKLLFINDSVINDSLQDGSLPPIH